MTWLAALDALLTQDDPPDLVTPTHVGRGHRVTCPRDPHKNPDVMKRDLAMAWLQHRTHDYGKDISCVVSVNKLRMVRRRA